MHMVLLDIEARSLILGEEDLHAALGESGREARVGGGFWLDGGELNQIDKVLAEDGSAQGHGFSDFAESARQIRRAGLRRRLQEEQARSGSLLARSVQTRCGAERLPGVRRHGDGHSSRHSSGDGVGASSIAAGKIFYRKSGKVRNTFAGLEDFPQSLRCALRSNVALRGS